MASISTTPRRSHCALRYPEDKKDPVVAEYMKKGALKACDEGEHRFFGDGREFMAGPEFTAAGA